MQEALGSQDADGMALTDVAEAGSVADPLENCVEVIVTFHPAPDPVLSPTSIGSDAVVVWSRPFRVRAGKVRFAGLEARERTPPVMGAIPMSGGGLGPVGLAVLVPPSIPRRIRSM